jgi:hypothetical protein
LWLCCGKRRKSLIFGVRDEEGFENEQRRTYHTTQVASSEELPPS